MAGSKSTSEIETTYEYPEKTVMNLIPEGLNGLKSVVLDRDRVGID